MALGFNSIEIPIENIVTPIEDTLPLTGKYSPDFDIGGWIWDRRRLEDLSDIKTRYFTFIGGHDVGLRDATIQDHWQSGSTHGLEFYDIKQFRKGDFLTWTPRVKTGGYSIFWEEKQLYSDYSCIEHIDPTLNRKDVNFHPLRDDCFQNTISATIYSRDETFLRRPYIALNYVVNFTGAITWDEDAEEWDADRLVTETGDGIDLSGLAWGSFAKRKHEFIVRYDEENENYVLITNNNYVIEVGQTDIEPKSNKEMVEILENLFEDKGSGQSSGRDVYTNYFPILKDDTLRVFARHSGNRYSEFERVETLNFSRSTDKHYSVDPDLGIITMGGYSAPDLILKTALDPDDVEVEFEIDDAASNSYPNQGIIRINGEEILYYGKSRNIFYDCVRGYGTQPPSDHAVGSAIKDIQHGKGTSDTDQIYVCYRAVPRIEYEVTPYDIRTANKALMLDVKAISNAETNQIIQITPVETNVAELILECDKEIIGGNIFGPVYFGTDWARLTARALDAVGNPVEDIEITIVLNENTGTLNGLQSYTALSNSAGEIYAFYNAPYDWDDVSKMVKKVTHWKGDTTFTIDPLPPGMETQPQQIQVYQILKHDPIIGTVGEKVPVISGENDPSYTGGETAGTSVGFAMIGLDAQWEDPVSKWEGGTISILLEPSGLKVSRKIVNIFEDFYGDEDGDGTMDYPAELIGGTKRTLVLLDSTIPSLDTGDTATHAWLMEPEAEEWDSHFRDGARVVLYEWLNDGDKDFTPVHPLTGELGAYYPVRPDDITSTTLIYRDRELPIPEPTEVDNNLGGYVVVSSDIVSFYAWCKDPVSGRMIVSNEIRIRLDNPSYLNGVDFKDSALPIPYGFTFVTEEHNVGTGIGGANFLTINPKASGVLSYNLSITSS